jgi:hypothetical protein
MNSSVVSTAPPKSMFRRTQNFDTHTLVWLDKCVDNCQIHMELRSIIDYVHVTDNIDSCTNYITNSQEQVCLILSDQYGPKIMPHIHHLRQLNSVFVYSKDKILNETWTKEYSKVSKIKPILC